ncbi:MAG: hypothetical protein G8345_20695, partial [Magnetococcales bacterium]|nr:hypothetical protein [Magnetococcales bacterium]
MALFIGGAVGVTTLDWQRHLPQWLSIVVTHLLEWPFQVAALEVREEKILFRSVKLGEFFQAEEGTLFWHPTWPLTAMLEQVLLKGVDLHLRISQGTLQPGKRERWPKMEETGGGLAVLPAKITCRPCRVTVDTPQGEVKGEGEASVQANGQMQAKLDEVEWAEQGWQGSSIQMNATLTPEGQPRRLNVKVEKVVLGDVGMALRGGELNLQLLPGKPWFTPAGQKFTLQRLTVGIPVGPVQLLFALQGKKKVVVENFQAQVLGGKMTVPPMHVNLAAESWQFTPALEKLDLAQVAQLAEIPGLTAEGSMSGHLPMTLSPAGMVVENGELMTDGPGHLRYDGGAEAEILLQHGVPEMVLTAIRDFHYEEIRVILNRALNGEMQAQVKLRGNNPQTYEGHPLEVNINLS